MTVTDSELSEMFSNIAQSLPEGRTQTRYALAVEILRAAWCQETCRPDLRSKWTKANPAMGQDAPSALVVHDLFGGSVTKCVVDGYGMYYGNLVTIGETGYSFSATMSQFPADRRIPFRDIVPRDHLLHSSRQLLEETPERYALLRSRVVQAMRQRLRVPAAG